MALLYGSSLVVDLTSWARHQPTTSSPLDDIVLELTFIVWILALFTLRFHWLKSARTGRRAATDEPPSVAVAGGAYVEGRPRTEAAAWPLAVAPMAPLVFPLVGAVPFHRLALTDNRLRRAAEPPAPAGRLRRGHPFLTTLAFASLLVTPLVVCFRLWRLAGPAGRRQYRLLAAASCPALFVLTWAPLGWGSAGAEYGCWTAAGLLYAFLLAAYQQCQNDLARSLGVQLPYGRCEVVRPTASRTGKPGTRS
ncbi:MULTISPECIES: hypothetical protein [Streptomyces]|uniref:DUF4328 domain-containing protein n=1 Tax=Streptomyces luteosporeus TaxID=173856 RepID=A0ABN3TK97_9ACTN